jgi:8-oxo-dGTP pyrophosphatase MutT (NUDIX family)
MGHPRREIDYERGLFRIELQPVEGRSEPYIFVRRIGAVTVLPILRDSAGEALVLTIDNRRRYYGMSELSLPGGDIDGGHDRPEAPVDAALRELREETGFGYADPTRQNVSIFALRPLSSTIEYPRFFAVARCLEYLGGEESNPVEAITVRPTALAEYVDELLHLRNGRTYPEVNSAIAKAGMECGRKAVLSWFISDLSVPNAAAVPNSFEPWLMAT